MNKIREARVLAGLSQEHLARRSGLTLGSVQKIETGRGVNPSYNALLAIARALGVAIEDIYAPEGDEAPIQGGAPRA